MPIPSIRPLLISADAVLVDDVLRLAAAAGAQVQVERDAAAARPHWADAPLVLVGRDLADAIGLAALPRRDAVAILSTETDDGEVWQRAVEVGASQVVMLPDGERWVVDALADAAEGIRDLARVVAVAGGRGGAGASVLAAALAVSAARRGEAVTLIDADPLGGGIDLLFYGEDSGGLRWPDLAGARGRVSATSLRAALPTFDGLAVLSWDRGDAAPVPGHAMTAVMGAAVRGAHLVVVDLPRTLDTAATVAAARSDVALLVVPAEVRAAAAAARVAAGLAASCADLRVVVRGPGPARLDPAAVAAALGLPLAGVVTSEPGLAEAIERGETPGRQRGPLAEFAGRFVDHLLAPEAAA